MWKKIVASVFAMTMVINPVFADPTRVLDMDDMYSEFNQKPIDENVRKMVYALYKSSKDVMEVCKPIKLSFYMLVVDGWFPAIVRLDMLCKNKTYNAGYAITASSRLTSAGLAVVANKGGCAGLSYVTISDPWGKESKKKYEVQVMMECDNKVIEKYCKERNDDTPKFCQSKLRRKKEKYEELKKYGITPSFKVTMRTIKD